MNKFMFVNGSIWEIILDEIDPWRRELARARHQLSKLRATIKP